MPEKKVFVVIPDRHRERLRHIVNQIHHLTKLLLPMKFVYFSYLYIVFCKVAFIQII